MGHFIYTMSLTTILLWALTLLHRFHVLLIGPHKVLVIQPHLRWGVVHRHVLLLCAKIQSTLPLYGHHDSISEVV